MTCLAGSMSRNEAILLVILAVDLRVPAVLGDDQIKPVLQKFFRREREVELDGKRKSSASTHWNRACSRSKNPQPQEKHKTYLGAEVRAVHVIPLPVRPVVQDTAGALFAGLLDRVFGDVPVVAEEVERVHLVVDLVGAGRRGLLDLGGGLVNRLFDRGGFIEGGIGFGSLVHLVRQTDNLLPVGLGGDHGGRCEGAGREEDKQEGGDEEHCCRVWLVRMKWKMEGGVDGRRKKERRGRDEGAYILIAMLMLKGLHHRNSGGRAPRWYGQPIGSL